MLQWMGLSISNSVKDYRHVYCFEIHGFEYSEIKLNDRRF